MKTRTLERLDLIAAEAEAKMLEEITRHNAALGQIEHQRRILAAYRERLTETWRSGGVIYAGQARLAEKFVSASDDASQKIDAEEPRARKALEDALQNLAAIQQRRRGLQEARRKALQQEERETERLLERELTWRPPNPGAPK
jgi:flagellar biosynthesis chaperone FliJ